MDRLRGNTSFGDCGNNSQGERVEISIPIFHSEKCIDLKQFVKDELNVLCAICANIMEEIKRMENDNVRLDEMIQIKNETIKRLESCIDKSRESELRLECDLHAISDVIKSQKALTPNISPSTAKCETDEDRRFENKLGEKENQTNQNRYSNARNFPLKNDGMNDINNNSSKPIQVWISTMTYSGMKRSSKTKCLLSS
ncbi:hypothetical protein ACJMK2_037144 [Sinanodonta woodiana]|uniref:Uncharacterized protein n=1 Tax=Sinanodonta woodiana TaxID=1069815 RepID=A0ABD3WKP2_SINWO